MAKVFLSHSHRDSAAAVELAKALKEGGNDIWLDKWEIDIGDSIVDKINDGIATADFLIVLLSQASVNSRWVKEEIAAATVRLAERGAFLIPVLLERCEVPPLLAHRRYANLQEEPERAIAEILAKIHKHDQQAQKLSDISKGIIERIFANSAKRIHELSDEDERRQQKEELAGKCQGLFAELELPANLYQLWFDYCFRRGKLEWDVFEIIGDLCREGSKETDSATKSAAAEWALGVLKRSLLKDEL